MTNSPAILTYNQYKNSQNHPDLAGEGDVEQHIAIIKNPKSRRGSFSNFAFPELHPKARLKAEPDTLLLLTRTRTDSRGRRHSVAVPLIPPPDGEKFEGGYHVERNPITGGARLVAPIQSRAIPVSPRPSGAIPKARTGRRHSVQVSSLSKDIEKLRLGERREGEGKSDDKNGQPPGSGMSESRKKELRRMSSKRRSSKQGFLHFLDLAIAN